MTCGKGLEVPPGPHTASSARALNHSLFLRPGSPMHSTSLLQTPGCYTSFEMLHPVGAGGSCGRPGCVITPSLI